MTDTEERDFLLDHVRNPRHSGEIADADGVGECKNPVCGDLVKIWHKGTMIKMKATGCTICVASASLMSELVNGKPQTEIFQLIKLMRESMKPGQSEWPQELIALSPLKRMRESPMKIPCTLVGWLALERAFQHQTNPISH